MDNIDIIGGVLLTLCVILILLPPRFDPAIRIKERQIAAGTHPESDPDLDALRQGKCPDCGSTALLAGPTGGMSMNVACNDCLMEFNVHAGFGTGPFAFDRTGKLTKGRARVFGITPEEYEEKISDREDK